MPQMGRMVRRVFRTAVAMAILTLFSVQGATPSYAWSTGQTAGVTCVDGKVAVGGTFTNKEPKSPYNDMDVFMSIKGTSLHSDVKTVVSGGGTQSFTVNLGVSQTSGGTAVFNLSWTDKHSGTDTRSVNFGALDCRGSKSIDAKALCDHEIDSSEWHIVINQIDAEKDAPKSVHIVWDNGKSADVSLDKFTGGTAHYTTTANLDANIKSVTASIYGTWSGQFNVSHGPACTKSVEIPTQDTIDECNPKGVSDNVAWKQKNLPADTAEIKWTESADKRTRTATLIGRTQWTDGTTAPKTWTLPEDSGKVCVTNVDLPLKQEFLDTCNPKGVDNNVQWAAELPASDDKVLWTESADHQVRTAALVDTKYTQWTDGTTAPKTWTLPEDSGVMCPTDARADIKTGEPTCSADGTAKVSANTQFAALRGELSQELGDHVAVFDAVEGHTFAGGATVLKVSYTVKAQLTGERCGSLAHTGGFALGTALLGSSLLAGGLLLLAGRRRNGSAA